MYQLRTDTIAALATAPGTGAIAVLRLSGPDTFSIVNRLFKGKNLLEQAANTIHFGRLVHQGVTLDEVLVSLFRAPHSYTKEDVIEISCHGSPLIAGKILKALLDEGARLAEPGEYTFRAFARGRFALNEAEAVADLIAADSDMAHKHALGQLRGGFTRMLSQLREELVHFASLLELELDFSEEDVEFADRRQLLALIQRIRSTIRGLSDSFQLGQVVREGVATVIAGKPNAGKSTLLNALLKEEKAIVSDIPGTTRDVIEDVLQLGGYKFRLQDTAGLREAADAIEAIGVKRSQEKIREAALLLYVCDLSATTLPAIEAEVNSLGHPELPRLIVGNKADLLNDDQLKPYREAGVYCVSGLQGAGLQTLEQALVEAVENLGQNGEVTLTNLRHVQALNATEEALSRAEASLSSGTTADWIAQDIRQALHQLGLITGQITTDDLLENIFSKFCIGK